MSVPLLGPQGRLVRQHVIDPEICIRCNTCERRCPTGAISHRRSYAIDFETCNACLACIRPCPTGAIDQWLVVDEPFSVETQLAWLTLPRALDVAVPGSKPVVEAADPEVVALLDLAHGGTNRRPPVSAGTPTVGTWPRDRPAIATVAGNLRVTDDTAVSDVRHIIFDLGTQHFPHLEGQTVGIAPPGADETGQPHAVRLYSVASARDGEKPATNNFAVTVKRVVEPRVKGAPFLGVASNYLCDLKVGATVPVTGPFGATFLMPDDPDAHVLMICTGTGGAPFRGFVHRKRRAMPDTKGHYTIFFGARSPSELPYFGPLQTVPREILDRELVYSRLPGKRKEYVQDRLRTRAENVASLLRDPTAHVYICGLRGLEDGVERVFAEISRTRGLDWFQIRDRMCDEGRFHVETY